MMADNTYSYEQVNELIQVSALALKLEGLEGKYNNLIDKMETAINKENTYGDKLEKTVEELKEKLDKSTNKLYQCKSEVEHTLKSDYVTNEQLKIALMEMQNHIEHSITASNESLRQEFKTFGNEINAQVKTNTDLLTKYRNFGAAGVAIALAISWAIGLYINAAKVTSSEQVVTSQSETQAILKQMREQQETINRQHQTILEHRGLPHE